MKENKQFHENKEIIYTAIYRYNTLYYQLYIDIIPAIYRYNTQLYIDIIPCRYDTSIR